MLRILLFTACGILPAWLSAQLSDRVWFAGFNEFPGVPGYGHAMLRLQGDSVAVTPENLAFNFESTSAVATDTAGQVLFYSNGCSVANRLHQIMPHGDQLNPGDISAQVCPQTGYIVPQGAMVLPAPGHSDQYYLIHLGATYDPVHKLNMGPLYYSLVDMSLEGGLGDVISKNNIILSGTELGGFTAIRHGNGRDWWVIASALSDHAWFTFLVTPEGISSRPVQQIQHFWPVCEKNGALAASPDGTRLAKWGECKVLQMDFDRCTGAINYSAEILTPTQWIPGGGVAYSPSGRYLYATSHNVLFRADLEAQVAKFDTLRFSYDPFLLSPYFVRGNSFHYLINGSDGRIYGNLPSRARQLHVIDNPEAADIAELVFLPRGLKLSVTNVRTLPFFPNYALYDAPGSVCDSLGINTPTSVHEYVDGLTSNIQLYPNPSSHEVTIDAGDTGIQQVRIRNAWGYEVQSNHPSAKDGRLHLPLGDLPAGMYVAGIQLENGKWVSKVFVIAR
ncbi:MAG: T9SS type A sorting domain-containing protein [Saprospiraceae bacterium]|nr:T9SS type A sorting domain-containing protein [Saprospiraceae bacterium]